MFVKNYKEPLWRETANKSVAAILWWPLVDGVECPRVDEYTVPILGKGKASENPILADTFLWGRGFTTMVIISEFDLSYNEDLDIFLWEQRESGLPSLRNTAEASWSQAAYPEVVQWWKEDLLYPEAEVRAMPAPAQWTPGCDDSP